MGMFDISRSFSATSHQLLHLGILVVQSIQSEVADSQINPKSMHGKF